MQTRLYPDAHKEILDVAVNISEKEAQQLATARREEQQAEQAIKLEVKKAEQALKIELLKEEQQADGAAAPRAHTRLAMYRGGVTSQAIYETA